MTTYRALLETLDAWFARGRDAAGPDVIPCKRACSACCHGVFDISAADAELVATGLAALPAEEATRVRIRATEQLREYATHLPEWTSPWNVDALDERAFDALTEALATAPCPALEDDGGCAIYASRPATCRMTGLAMDTVSVGCLDNECPIQSDFPRYAALAPVPFDLMAFEDDAERHDAAAAARAFHTTTIAGAIAPPR